MGLMSIDSLHERGQRERVASVLDAEDGEQEAVDEEKNGTPEQNPHLLLLGISHSWDLHDQGDRCERQKTICKC